jgi:hypothetical protein
VAKPQVDARANEKEESAKPATGVRPGERKVIEGS